MTVSIAKRPQTEAIALLAAACGRGAPDTGCEAGPAELEAHGLLPWLKRRGIAAHWQAHLGVPVGPPEPPAMVAVANLCAQLANEVEERVLRGKRFAVVGGDHSCAVGTWSGVHRAFQGKSLGLIWLDAHMDSHTPDTSPSGALHGMPLACLLGFGLEPLIELATPAPALSPQHLCLVGVRSFEPGEEALLRRLGVRIFFMEEVEQRGLGEVLREAASLVQAGTAGFGLSLDLDVLDPADAPGVGTPEPRGVRATELLPLLPSICDHEGFLGLEIVEFNPSRDRAEMTARLVRELLAACLLEGEMP